MMSMHFSIRYLTAYRYDSAVIDNLNALRVTPTTNANQRVDDFGVRVTPESRLHRHADYFGTQVIEFGIVKPHQALTIDVRARVVTAEPPEPPDASWGSLEASNYQTAAGEFLLPFGSEPAHPAIDELVGLTRSTTPLKTLLLVCELIPDHFEYRAGVTYVGSTIADLLEAGAGVCQDFVHLALLLLRRHGIAARYVSGYLWASDAEHGADSIEVQTHAWLEALLPGAGDGAREPLWVGADPTNRGLAGGAHVKIGHGRHYTDVPPIKGVYRGMANAEFDTSVKMTRLDTATAARP